MKLLLHRIAKQNDYTIGRLYIDGKYFCDTLEDKDRGLSNDMTLSYIKSVKVYGETAIPTGTYEVVISYSNRFKKKLPELLNVPGFSGIRIHAGNTALDTHGCVLVGQNKVKGKVINSRETMTKLQPLIE